MIDIDVEVNQKYPLGTVTYFWDGQLINYDGGKKVFEYTFTDKSLEEIMEEVDAYSVQHKVKKLLGTEQTYVPDNGDQSTDKVNKIESYEKSESEINNDVKI